MMLSALILCRDAEKTIIKCLESIQGKVDEVKIVYDTRTIDKSYDKIMEYVSNNFLPYNIHNYDWASDSFADARNYGLSKLLGTHTFYIDADEECTHFETFDENLDFIWCKVWKDGQMFYSPRIFRNDKSIQYRFARHNEFPLDGLKGAYSEIEFKGQTQTSPEENIIKTEALLERHFKQLEEEDNPTLHFRISNCYRALGDWNKAIEFAHLSFTDNISTEAKAQACLNLYLCYRQTKRHYTAHQYLELSVGLLPEQRQAKMFLYENLIQMKSYDSAKKLREEIESIKVSKLPLDLSEAQCNKLFQEIK